MVTVGYPEKVDVAPKWPASPEYYNSAITVNADGETIANYRKSFLYYTDETWALEGPDGFFDGAIEGLGNVAIAVGPTGSDFTVDGGKSWLGFDNGTFDAVECVSKRMCWASGSKGRVARLVLKF